ncbi:MAG: hypothetical protein VX335_04395, partial [Pseudomonadota bacterium]|nr:hypothetical protein [Pseudomonadota bacterium]
MYLNNIKRFLTVILSLIIFTSFFGTTYLISIPHGIISTLLMPIISGDNMSKVGFYEQLHSNFGAIYHIFNLIGLKFINSTPKLQLFDLIPLTSFFWAILCCFFYLLCNYSLEKKYKISNIILLFAISSIF